MSKNNGKSISKNVSGKYSQKRLDYAKKSSADLLITASKRSVRKTVEPTSDLIGN